MVTKCGRAIIVSTIILATTLVNPIAGQAGRSGETESARIAFIVRDSMHLRVENTAGRIYEIRNVTVQGDRLRGVEEGSGQLVEIQMRHVQRLWRRGSAAGTGFIIGGVVGMLAGAAGGVALANFSLWSSASPSSGEEVGAAALGALLGGLSVGIFGALIAAPIRKWKTAYRAPVQRVEPLVSSKAIGLRIAF